MSRQEIAKPKRRPAVCPHGNLKRQCLACEDEATIKRLERKIAALEKDRVFARSLLLLGQMAVYKAAMTRFDEIVKDQGSIEKYLFKVKNSPYSTAKSKALTRACARSLKLRKGK